MKAAKAKEAASLPKQPQPAQSRSMPDLEKGEGAGAAEQQALLQVPSLLPSFSPDCVLTLKIGCCLRHCDLHVLPAGLLYSLMV